MQSQIKRWGNSAAVRLSSKIMAQAKLDVSSPIDIVVKGGKIVIEPAENAPRKVNLPFSEAYLLNGLDAHGAHADELTQPTRPVVQTVQQADRTADLLPDQHQHSRCCH